MRFIGNKETIVPQIRELLTRKGLTGRGLVLFDAFCGTGSVADELKDSFDLIVNDIMNWSVLFAKGRLHSADCAFEYLDYNPFDFLNGNARKRHGFIYRNYSPGGSNRMDRSIFAIDSRQRKRRLFVQLPRTCVFLKALCLTS